MFTHSIFLRSRKRTTEYRRYREKHNKDKNQSNKKQKYDRVKT